MRLDDVIQQPGRLERNQLDATLAKACVSLPCKIVKYDSTQRTVDVQPLVREVGVQEDPPLLMGVPVWFPGSFTYDISVGDECLVVFADRSIDAWWQSGKVSNPVSARRHNLSDGFAFVGIRSLQNVSEGINLNEALSEMVGATYLADGKSGLVPKPVAGDNIKFLRGDGTWQEVEGGGSGGNAGVIWVEGTITNTSGAYSTTFNDPRIVSSMKCLTLELGTPGIFNGEITVSCANGSITISCPEVDGTSTFKASFIGSMVTSSEYTILDNKKADKDTDAVVGNIAVFDSSGNPIDSGHSLSEYITDISGKADKVSNATSGNVATLNGSGNLVDSGKTLGKSVPADAVFTDTTYSNATTSSAGLMSAADKTKLDNTSVRAGSRNWWEAPGGEICAYKYEGENTTTYKLPSPYCVILVMKQTNSRGVAIAIKWSSSTTLMWIARLHDDTSSSNFSSWVKVHTEDDFKYNTLTQNYTIGANLSSQKIVFSYNKDNEYRNFMVTWAEDVFLFTSVGWNTSQTSITKTNLKGSNGMTITKSYTTDRIVITFTASAGTSTMSIIPLTSMITNGCSISTQAK